MSASISCKINELYLVWCIRPTPPRTKCRQNHASSGEGKEERRGGGLTRQAPQMRFLAVELQLDAAADAVEEGAEEDGLRVGDVDVLAPRDDEDLGREAAGVEDLFRAEDEVGRAVRRRCVRGVMGRE